MLIKSNRPLYKIVVEETLDQLSSGVLKVGDRFPPEADYAAALGISRHTLRQAFSQLEQVGVIKRRKRGGTEVIANKPAQRFSIQPSGFYNALGVIRETVFDITDVGIVDNSAHNDLANHANASSEWVCCTGTRTIKDQRTPFVWSQVFVNGRFSEISVRAGDSPASIYQLIQNRYGETMTRIRQRYSAALCSDDVAQALRLETGKPVLTHVAELYNANGTVLVVADSTYDPTRFQLITDVNVADIN